MTNAKQSIEIIEGLTVELTAEQLEEVSRKLQSAKDKTKKVPEPKLKVGDWIRFIGDSIYAVTGKAYKVIGLNNGSPRVIDEEGTPNTFFGGSYEIIDKLTPFDRAGRAPGEYKIGDIVRVTNDNHEHRVGDINIIHGHRPAGFDYALANRLDGKWTGCINAKNIELVTPVENRVDTAEGGERA